MGWQGVRSGPDWTDIRSFLREMEKLHQCRCTMIIEPAGSDDGPEMRCTLLMVKNVPGSGLARSELVATTTWPSPSHRTMEGAIYNLCHAADFKALNDWWVQIPLLPEGELGRPRDK